MCVCVSQKVSQASGNGGLKYSTLRVPELSSTSQPPISQAAGGDFLAKLALNGGLYMSQQASNDASSFSLEAQHRQMMSRLGLQVLNYLLYQYKSTNPDGISDVFLNISESAWVIFIWRRHQRSFQCPQQFVVVFHSPRDVVTRVAHPGHVSVSEGAGSS